MALSTSDAAPSGPRAEGLLAEYLSNPLGIDSRKPGFSWKVSSPRRGVRQSAYQIQVATDRRALERGGADLWDSGKVQSSRCTAVTYDGPDIPSRTTFFWRVRVWDERDAAGDYSRPASFETALLDPADWEARWITVSDEPGGNGYHSQFADNMDVAKWVQVDLGNPYPIAQIVLYPARPYNWTHDQPGFGFPIRYRIEADDDPTFPAPRLLADRTDRDQPNPGTEPVVIDVGGRTERYIRLTATRLHHPRDSRPLLALAEMEVRDAAGNNLALHAVVEALDSIEQSGWSTRMLTDGGRVSREPQRAAPMLRREFDVEKPVERARAYVTGLGYYELYLNGQKVGDRVLDPPYTNYHKRVYYSVYDVTKLLQKGANCAGAMLGRGWWRESPRLLAQIEIEYKDGTGAVVTTDDSWRWSRGPLLENSLYDGEVYDARAELTGWDRPGFDDSTWEKAAVVEMPGTTLSAQTIQPIKVVQTLKPKSVASPKPDIYVFDFGQNFSGWCHLTVSGPAGTQVSLKHAEVLHEDGTVNQQNLRSAKARDVYILRGETVEEYEPRFTYHGFRYVQVEGFPGQPTLDSIRGRVVHTALEPRGTFECSNRMLNRVQECAQWGERTNFHSVPTDCPQRDERQGWMGDAHMSANAMLYNFNMPPAYSKFLRDIADAQREDGAVPDTVPHVWGSNPGDPMWAAAYIFILWDTYRHTGDLSLLKRHYDGVRRYVELLRREALDCILERNNYGDWIAVVETPKPLISTGSFCLVALLLARIADALGRSGEAREYLALCGRIADAFNARFYDASAGHYGNGSQFSNALPLYLGIVPPERKAQVVEKLVTDIVENHKGHLSTGFVGTPFLMDTLVREGRADLAYTIAAQKDYPGWGYMVAMGATTIWELWKYEVGPGMNSHNHPALGWVSAWFYSALAGLTPDEAYPGWERFSVKPHVVGDLRWAKARIETVRGAVSSSWKLTPGGTILEVEVPGNSTAEVFVPKRKQGPAAVSEGGVPVWKDGKLVFAVAGITAAEDAGEWVRLQVGSGRYRFELMQ